MTIEGKYYRCSLHPEGRTKAAEDTKLRSGFHQQPDLKNIRADGNGDGSAYSMRSASASKKAWTALISAGLISKILKRRSKICTSVIKAWSWSADG
jgi:hypothetical protein